MIYKKADTYNRKYYYARLNCSERWVEFECPKEAWAKEYIQKQNFDLQNCTCARYFTNGSVASLQEHEYVSAYMKSIKTIPPNLYPCPGNIITHTFYVNPATPQLEAGLLLFSNSLG